MVDDYEVTEDLPTDTELLAAQDSRWRPQTVEELRQEAGRHMLIARRLCAKADRLEAQGVRSKAELFSRRSMHGVEYIVGDFGVTSIPDDSEPTADELLMDQARERLGHQPYRCEGSDPDAGVS